MCLGHSMKELLCSSLYVWIKYLVQTGFGIGQGLILTVLKVFEAVSQEPLELKQNAYLKLMLLISSYYSLK